MPEVRKRRNGELTRRLLDLARARRRGAGPGTLAPTLALRLGPDQLRDMARQDRHGDAERRLEQARDAFHPGSLPGVAVLEHVEGGVRLRLHWEFDARNAVQGNSAWLTASFRL